MKKSRMLILVLSATAVIVGAFVVYRLSSGRSPFQDRLTGSLRDNASGLKAGRNDATEYGGLLAASIPMANAQINAVQGEALRAAAASWLSAYAAEDSREVRLQMDRAGITLPLNWDDQDVANASFEQSVQVLRQVSFDPMKTEVIIIKEGQVRPWDDHPRRSASRDTARPMLAAPEARTRLVRREVLLTGTLPTLEGPPATVVLGIEFAWDVSRSIWIPIRNTWYDLPNEIEGLAPIL